MQHRSRLVLVACCLAGFVPIQIGAGTRMACSADSPHARADYRASLLPALGPDLSSEFGVKITEDAASEAFELFKIDKFDEAIKSLDDVTLDRANKDLERNRELKLTAGILIARSGTKGCLPKAIERVNAAKLGSDKRGTSLKAQIVLTAIRQAPKNGTDNLPDLKSRDKWLAAIDVAREFHEKELIKDEGKFGTKIRTRKFNELQTVVKACSEKMELINVIQHKPEKNREIAAAYVKTLRECRRDIELEERDIHADIRECENDISDTSGNEGKIRKARKKMEGCEKDLRESEKADAFIAAEIAKFAN